MNKSHYYILLIALLGPLALLGQRRPGLRTVDESVLTNSAARSLGNIRSGGSGKSMDSLERRDYSDDTIAISYRLPTTTLALKLDSSIRDFTSRFPIPADHIYLGNNGTPTRSLLFSPILQPGWDAGFHALDVYRWKLENVRFFNTTKPYTELNYMLGSQTEQMIEAFHTQNVKPNWNILFNYRLINSPGYFKNQKTNHNNYLISSWYQSPKKRYNNYFAFLANNLLAGENGGLLNDQDYLNDPIYKDRFNIPTQLGGDGSAVTGFFTNTVTTGNKYKDIHFMMRQQYDLGKKDSLVTDSTIVPLFYPRLRFEHTLSYHLYNYRFTDGLADTGYYNTYYGQGFTDLIDTFTLGDKWSRLVNDFSIIQFPDANNLQQYVKLGAALENLTGQFLSGKHQFHNFYAHGEYRNRTRNRKWDMALAGTLYINGLNGGDYQAQVSLKRFLPKNGTSLELGFNNTNRSPSFIFDTRSSFYLESARDFQKENITLISASIYQPKWNLRLTGQYYLVSNMTYFNGYYQPQQESSLFNVLQVTIQKVFHLGKHWNWYSDIYIQQKTGDVELNLPVVFTRQRIALEGLFFSNLNLSTGLEFRYHSPYKPDAYSPVLGRFFYQDNLSINNLPDIHAFMHFRIRSMKVYLRVENLNTATNKYGFGFYNNNEVAPGYINPGMVVRLGIFWNFVN